MAIMNTNVGVPYIGFNFVCRNQPACVGRVQTDFNLTAKPRIVST